MISKKLWGIFLPKKINIEVYEEEKYNGGCGDVVIYSQVFNWISIIEKIDT